MENLNKYKGQNIWKTAKLTSELNKNVKWTKIKKQFKNNFLCGNNQITYNILNINIAIFW